MRAQKLLISTMLSLFAFNSLSQEMTTYLSPYGPDETVERFKSVIEDKGLILFDVINHHVTAQGIDRDMRPTIVVLFENPQIGTEWTLCEQTVAIDLPFKVLIWQDESDETFLSYSNPRLIGKRHQVKGCPEITDQINRIMVRVINETIKQS